MRQVSLNQVLAALLLPAVAGLLGLLYLVVVPLQGRPFLFSSERMRSPDRAFALYKIRTMQPQAEGAEQTALGGHQLFRVTWIGAFLRRSRLDELPQIFNVLRGDMGFIGPRPPLRKYVEAYPEIYARVLDGMRPGITGLATVMLHAREERLLSACRSAEETEAVYRRHCIPWKARLDLLYRRRRGWVLNAVILWRTLSRLYPRSGSALSSRGAGRVRSSSARSPHRGWPGAPSDLQISR